MVSQKLPSATTHYCKTHACVSMCGPSSRRPEAGCDTPEAIAEATFSCQLYASDTESTTCLFSLLEILVLPQLSPCVVIYSFAAKNLPKKHNGRVSLSVPTHEQ